MTDTSEARARAARRRQSIAAGWRRDDRCERMVKLQEADPERFDQLYGARGALQVGLYLSGRAAAAAGDDLGPEAA